MDFDRDDRPRRGGGGGRSGGGGEYRRGGREDRDDRDRQGREDGGRRGGRGRRARSYYCADGRCFDYKDVGTLQKFIGETGKIRPRRQTGNCARCQRELAREVKRARHLALLPFVDGND